MEIFKELDIDISPNTKVRDLPMGKQQMVEIATAVLKDAKIIILDEPTTSLANKERAKLNEIVARLKKENKLIIYITHELENAIDHKRPHLRAKGRKERGRGQELRAHEAGRRRHDDRHKGRQGLCQIRAEILNTRTYSNSRM